MRELAWSLVKGSCAILRWWKQDLKSIPIELVFNVEFIRYEHKWDLYVKTSLAVALCFFTVLWAELLDGCSSSSHQCPSTCPWLRYTLWTMTFAVFSPNSVSWLPWPKGLSHFYGDRRSLCSGGWRWTVSAWTGSCWGSSCLDAVNEAPVCYQRPEFTLLTTLSWLTEGLKL